MKKLTTKEFVSRSRLIHGNNYSYSGVCYIGNKDKVLIECKAHGKFLQRPAEHLRGHGCPSCSVDRLAKASRLTQKVFLCRAREVHGNTYDYSLSKYTGNKVKVAILCSHHGAFYQTPNDHLSGHGCADCGIGLSKKCRRKKYRLGKREIVVQGYEPQALDYIQRELKIKGEELVTGKEVPVVRYKQEGKQRRHLPDIFVPRQNRLVEVKSPYTFLATLKILKRKRRGAIAQGYKYSVLVMKGTGERVHLPSKWFLISQQSLLKHIGRE